MAKKKANAALVQAAAASPEAQQPEAVLPQAGPAVIEQPVKEPVSNAQVLGFWAVVLAMALTAWLLDYFMPGLRERDVERWLMLPFGLFLAYNLLRLR